MPNMSYCRFQNTHLDLEDCFDYMADLDDLSDAERNAREELTSLCVDMACEYGHAVNRKCLEI